MTTGSMRLQKNDIDCDALGISTFDLIDPVPERFQDFERQHHAELQSALVYCKVPAENLTDIQKLEKCGFGFCEFQMSMKRSLRSIPAVGNYPYVYEQIVAFEDLSQVLGMARTIFEHDRISRDPGLKSESGGKRYESYVLKSFHAANERVFGLRSLATGELVGFTTSRVMDEKNLRLLIGGVANEYKAVGLGLILELMMLRHYKQEGFHTLYSAISGINYPIMRLEVSHIGFVVYASHVVLRKFYS